MKKRVIYISLGIILVLLICLGIWFVAFYLGNEAILDFIIAG